MHGYELKMRFKEMLRNGQHYFLQDTKEQMCTKYNCKATVLGRVFAELEREGYVRVIPGTRGRGKVTKYLPVNKSELLKVQSGIDDPELQEFFTFAQGFVNVIKEKNHYKKLYERMKETFNSVAVE